MTTSSEDVLLSVGHVRFKKGDGTLYVMNQRLAWMLENRDTVAVSHKYADIKTQKISPAGKPKVQLQVVLHDGTCSTFHFVNPAGAEAQAKDRDQVKMLLQNLLPKFKRQIDGELEMKSRLLSLHPTLKHLYEDLVISKVINSEEYWNTPTLKNYTESNNIKQEAGVSGAFLADIQPQTDGCNGLKYNLTQDVIDAIFKTYPAVRKKHGDYVPKKMTEAEFWTKFFQSHYFHRDRIASSSSKDLFGECAKMDDQAIASAMKHTTLDLTVDIPSFTEPQPLADDEPPEPKGDSTSIHRNMIKRFNQHSIMVLKASHKTNNSNNSSSSSNSNKTTNNNNKTENGVVGNGVEKRAAETKPDAPPDKKRRIMEQIHYEDLEAGNDNGETQELKLSKVERYLLGPSSQVHQSGPNTNPPPLSALASICQAWSSGQQCSRPARVSAAAAVAALGELSPGGALMRHHHAASMAREYTAVCAVPQACRRGELSPGGALMRHHHAASMAREYLCTDGCPSVLHPRRVGGGELIPPDVASELQRIYLSGGELLRELWRCFPAPAAAGADADDNVAKADKFYEALLRFRNVKLRPFEVSDLSVACDVAGADADDNVAKADKFYEALLRFRNVKLRPFEVSDLSVACDVAGADADDNVAKADKFYEALLRFRNVKLRPFEEKMLRDLTPLATSLTRHMNQMIDAACAKYAMWQQRQAKLR
ncbi:general transcription factor IIH subunit 1 [Ostrinia nubilalis]|uniref:general transcription factor IIH subunit 1 n=1 Tax=Ostrinia nubilalis TaxID=29057 RepID=UPI003082438B